MIITKHTTSKQIADEYAHAMSEQIRVKLAYAIERYAAFNACAAELATRKQFDEFGNDQDSYIELGIWMNKAFNVEEEVATINQQHAISKQEALKLFWTTIELMSKAGFIAPLIDYKLVHVGSIEKLVDGEIVPVSFTGPKMLLYIKLAYVIPVF